MASVTFVGSIDRARPQRGRWSGAFLSVPSASLFTSKALFTRKAGFAPVSDELGEVTRSPSRTNRRTVVPNIGVPELLIIFLILLLLFGASRLAGIGTSLGRSIREFRREVKEDDRPTADGTSMSEGRSSEPQASKKA